MPGDDTVELVRQEVEAQTPTWKWTVGVLGAIIVIAAPVAVWAGSIKSDTESVARTSTSLLENQGKVVEALSRHSERIVKVEADQESIHRQLSSVERTIEKIDAKLDRALEKK